MDCRHHPAFHLRRHASVGGRVAGHGRGGVPRRHRCRRRTRASGRSSASTPTPKRRSPAMRPRRCCAFRSSHSTCRSTGMTVTATSIVAPATSRARPHWWSRAISASPRTATGSSASSRTSSSAWTSISSRVARTLRYHITEISIVTPEENAVLAPTERPSVTLVTCYPFYFVGSAPKRFIVRGELDENQTQTLINDLSKRNMQRRDT